MPLKRVIEDGTDDTEGQGFRMGVSDGVEDDTEGNHASTGHITDGVEDDTEGNAARIRFAKDGVEDDTEGNIFRRS